MLTVLLSILFSKTLTLSNLSLSLLLNWFNHHPFIAIMVIYNVLSDCLTIIGMVLMMITGIVDSGFEKEDN